MPEITLTPANSTVTFSGNYTVAMIDPGAVGSDQSEGQNRHWLVNGATVSGKCSLRAHLTECRVTFSSQVANSHMRAPLRSPNTPDPPLLPVLDHTGQHMGTFHLSCLTFRHAPRYTIVVYAQGTSFTPPDDLSGPTPGVVPFVFPDYVKNTNLGPLVAGIYYQVEEGTATASIPATSSVISSTLPAAHSSSSGVSSSTSSGSKPTSTSGGNNSTGGAIGKAISGSLLGLTAALGYIML